MEAVFQDCVREEAAAGRTVLLSSHILAEVEALCDRVSIIRAGRHRAARHARRAAAPDPHDGRRRDPEARRRPGRRAGGGSRRAARRPGQLRRRHRPPRRGDELPRRRRGSARWSATRRPSRSCSCASTATAPSRCRRDPRTRGHRRAGPAGAPPGPGPAAGVDPRADRAHLLLRELDGTTFSSQAAIDSYARTYAASPAMTALAGPPIALDTLAGIVISKVSFIGYVGVCADGGPRGGPAHPRRGGGGPRRAAPLHGRSDARPPAAPRPW